MSRNAPGTEGAFSTDARHASDLGSASLYAESTGKPGEQTNIATSTKNDAVHIMLLVLDSKPFVVVVARAPAFFRQMCSLAFACSSTSSSSPESSRRCESVDCPHFVFV